MCLIVYAASPQPLATIAWDEKHPAFHVQDVAAGDPVRMQFDYPYVYNLRSHEWCGCGFAHRDFDGTESNERALAVASAASLSGFLASARAAGPVDVFACWSGNEASPRPAARERLTSKMAADTEHWMDVHVAASQDGVFAYEFEPW